jgi:hypothetical protein
MSQIQKIIPLVCLDAKERRAAATGNNAAWICPCGRRLPLLGKSGDAKGPSEGFKVHCPDCGRVFFVVPATTKMSAAREVRELERT